MTGADATALRADLVSGARGVREVVEETLDAIERLDGRLGAFHEVCAERARERARELERARAAGEPCGALFGVPLAIKANMCWQGVEANCGSRILAGYRPPYTATFVQRLLDAGAVVVGTTHMDEFAMGSSGENSAYHVARNPWDEARTPGGSSSGSAAAVAAGLVPVALGSDTGGSVRQPASFCGITGLKPTYGRVSRYGLVAFGSSLDHVSPLARSVRDVERVLGAMSGRDPLDATSLDEPPFAPEARRDLAGLRVGVPAEYFPDTLPAALRAVVEQALAEWKALGAELVPVSLPHTGYAIPTYYVVATAEASSNLARYDGVRYGVRAAGDGSLHGMIAATRDAGFGPEVKRRILLGTYVLSSGYYEAWYGRALKVRGLLARDFARAFEAVDLVVGPTSPSAAFRLGERTEDPVAMYLSDLLTAPVSLAGLPAVSVPCGFVREEGARLPVGLQVVGPPGADARVLSAARVFQEASEHHRALPPLRAPALGGAA